MEQKKRELLDELITAKWGTSLSTPIKPTPDSDFEEYEDEDNSPRVIPVTRDLVNCNCKAINLQP